MQPITFKAVPGVQAQPQARWNDLGAAIGQQSLRIGLAPLDAPLGNGGDLAPNLCPGQAKTN
jgi:hypothetical protein